MDRLYWLLILGVAVAIDYYIFNDSKAKEIDLGDGYTNAGLSWWRSIIGVMMIPILVVSAGGLLMGYALDKDIIEGMLLAGLFLNGVFNGIYAGIMCLVFRKMDTEDSVRFSKSPYTLKVGKP